MEHKDIKFTKTFTITAVKGQTQHKGEYFKYFGITPFSCSLYGEKAEDILNVECTVCEDQNPHEAPDYWGWFDFKSGWQSGGLIQPSYIQFKMCFPYGYEVEEKAGKGKAYRLDVKEIK